jgi:hypothetical protein
MGQDLKPDCHRRAYLSVTQLFKLKKLSFYNPSKLEVNSKLIKELLLQCSNDQQTSERQLKQGNQIHISFKIING